MAAIHFGLRAGEAKDFWKPPSRFEMKPMAKTITFRIVNLSVAMPTLAKTCKSVQMPEKKRTQSIDFRETLEET